MRYRKPSNYWEKLDKYQQYLSQEKAANCFGKWRECFDNENRELILEIGCGKGGFLIEQAKRYPGINFIGIERTPSLMLNALEYIKKNEMNNILLSGLNAQFLEEFFAPGEIDRLYLNFSDPWPKKRNAKRRLTSSVFLEKYQQILSSNKKVAFKTDNKSLFEFTILELSAKGHLIVSIDIDLHAKGIDPEDDRLILTEYEKRFMEQKIPIYRLEAKLIDGRS